MRLRNTTLQQGHLSVCQFSSVFQHINRKSLSIQSTQRLEIDPTCILVDVQKDSCARLIIVWTATDGKQPKCPLVLTARGHQTDEKSTSEFTRAGSATPRGGGGISRCSAFTGPQVMMLQGSLTLKTLQEHDSIFDKVWICLHALSWCSAYFKHIEH